MKRRHVATQTALAVLAILVFAGSSSAFQLTGVGGRFGSLDPEARDQTAAFGAHLEFETIGSQLHLMPSVLYWSSDRLSDLNPNLDFTYHLAPAGEVSPYVGGGVGLHAYEIEDAPDPGTDAGANLLVGLVFPARTASFFIEGRYVATERTQTSILAGITARLGP